MTFNLSTLHINFFPSDSLFKKMNFGIERVKAVSPSFLKPWEKIIGTERLVLSDIVASLNLLYGLVETALPNFQSACGESEQVQKILKGVAFESNKHTKTENS